MRLVGTILWAVGGAVAATALIVVTISAAGGEIERADAAVAGVIGIVATVVALIGVGVFRGR
jgi:hypothetical protein